MTKRADADATRRAGATSAAREKRIVNELHVAELKGGKGQEECDKSELGRLSLDAGRRGGGMVHFSKHG